jgi:hypothetical protein
MKIITPLALSLLAAGQLLAADTNTTDQVKTAVTKLKDQPNYSWTTTQAMPGMPFTPEPLHGKTGSDGLALVTQNFNDNTTQVAFKGDKIAVLADNQWQAVATNQDAGDMGNFPMMIARMLAGSGTAATEAETLLGRVKELKAGDDGLWSGDLTDKGVAGLLSFGPRPGGDTGVKDGKGTVKFWVKDGVLVKFESHAEGRVPGPDQNEQDMNMTRTTEISDAGKTQVEIPEAAKKILAGN